MTTHGCSSEPFSVRAKGRAARWSGIRTRGIGTAATGWRYVGAEYVAGRPTHHVACVGEHALDIDLWLDVETRLILRTREPETDDAGQPIPGQFGTTEVTEIGFGEQPAALFEAPDGVVHMTSEAYSAYLCTRDVKTDEEVGFGTRDCPTLTEAEATPLPTPTPMPTVRPEPSDCAVRPGQSEPTGPLTWTQASLKTDWPAPIRTEPAGGALVLPWPEAIAEERGRHRYTDPSGDTGSDCHPWVDIREVTAPGSWKLASNQPPVVHPNKLWMAYGAVFDVDSDGVADWRFGIDNMPVDAKGERPHREWVTDLHSGRTEAAAGPPYGLSPFGASRYPAGGDFGVRIDIFGPGRLGQFPKSSEQLASDVHFYAWASVIEDGRVVATDYAPDVGWLDPSILGVGRNEASPFGGINTVCVVPPQPGCRETDRDGFDITFTVSDGWTWNTSDHVDDRGKHVQARDGLIKKATGRLGPQGMSLQFLRGGWLFSDPCRKVNTRPDIRVGPTADDFANALADHPLLDVTTPVPVTLGGFKGKYLDLQVPSNIADCTAGYVPWAPTYYAPAPNHRWHIWSLDVDGVRVVVLSEDFVGTSPADLAEMQAVIESIQIGP